MYGRLSAFPENYAFTEILFRHSSSKRRRARTATQGVRGRRGHTVSLLNLSTLCREVICSVQYTLREQRAGIRRRKPLNLFDLLHVLTVDTNSVGSPV